MTVTVDDPANPSPVQASFTLKVWTWCDDWQLEFIDSYLPPTSLTYFINSAAEAITFDLDRIRTRDIGDGCKLIG